MKQQLLEQFTLGNFRALILLFRDCEATFPGKQYPVCTFGNYGKPGSFGARVNPTTFAMPIDDHFATFTVGLLGELTLNLHAPTAYSVDTVNGGIANPVHKTHVSQLAADELAAWAESVSR